MKKKPLQRRNPDNPVIQEYDRAVLRGQGSYHVIHQNGVWIVKKMGASKGRSFDTQGSAVDTAKNLARDARTDVFIHGRDGRIRERSSYANEPQ
jgi:hypothetical protein